MAVAAVSTETWLLEHYVLFSLSQISFRVMSPGRNSDSARGCCGQVVSGLAAANLEVYRFDAGELGPPRWSQKKVCGSTYNSGLRCTAAMVCIPAASLSNRGLTVSFIQVAAEAVTDDVEKEGAAARTTTKLQLATIRLTIGPSNTLGLGNIHSKRIPAMRSDGIHLASRRFCDSRRTVQHNLVHTCRNTDPPPPRQEPRSLPPPLLEGKAARQAPHATLLGPRVNSPSPNCEIGEKATSSQGLSASYANRSDQISSRQHHDLAGFSCKFVINAQGGDGSHQDTCLCRHQRCGFALQLMLALEYILDQCGLHMAPGGLEAWSPTVTSAYTTTHCLSRIRDWSVQFREFRGGGNDTRGLPYYSCSQKQSNFASWAEAE